MLRFIVLSLLCVIPASAQSLDFRLPTDNRHLLTGEPEKFYMYVNRTFEGESSKPWQGGSWGLVRNPVRVDGEIQYLRFHEGIDIAPVRRDRAGNPRDLVKSIARGTVMHVNSHAGRSNYGRYLVVAHPVDGGDHQVFSLYAHLAEITVKPKDKVVTGSVLGRMGYTGVGLNRTRAHLHLELGLLLSHDFQKWFDRYFASTNHHGQFNGMNLIGLDVAEFFIQQEKNPELTVTEFVRQSPPHFKITVPRRGRFSFVERHPWLVDGNRSEPGHSWEISLTATGLPTRIKVSQRKVSEPIVSSVRKHDLDHRYLTRGLLRGEGASVTLSPNGKKFVQLLTGR